MMTKGNEVGAQANRPSGLTDILEHATVEISVALNGLLADVFVA
jgi:hypothetical protein